MDRQSSGLGRNIREIQLMRSGGLGTPYRASLWILFLLSSSMVASLSVLGLSRHSHLAQPSELPTDCADRDNQGRNNEP